MPVRPFIALLALLPVAAFAAGPDCPKLSEFPEMMCRANAHGWFYAADAKTATQMAEDAAAVAEGFEQAFGRPAPRGAVVFTNTGDALADDSVARLRAAGAVWVKSWFDTQRRMTELVTRRQHPSASDGEIAHLVDEALRAMPAGGKVDNRNVLRHEIGHSVFTHAFWPGFDAEAPDAFPDGPRYGGPAPDWLDEIAAELMETDAEKIHTRKDLAAAHANGALWPLAEFFDMPHPVLQQSGLMRFAGPPDAADTAPSDGGGPVAPGTWVTFTLDEGSEDRTFDFYAQALGFAEFLIESSSDSSVLGHIATHIAGGGGITGWLAEHGAAHGLADSVADLEHAWQAWLEQRH